MAYALIAKKMNIWAYKVGVGLALVTGFAFGWSNMVQVADSGHPENLVYYSVLVVGIVGALLARLEPRGLAYTLFAMAATLALIVVVLLRAHRPTLRGIWPSAMVPTWCCSSLQVCCSGTRVWRIEVKPRPITIGPPARRAPRFGLLYLNS